MFRRLFALEATAFRVQLDELRHLAHDAESQVAETARELFSISRHAAPSGIWNFRSPV